MKTVDKLLKKTTKRKNLRWRNVGYRIRRRWDWSKKLVRCNQRYKRRFRVLRRRGPRIDETRGRQYRRRGRRSQLGRELRLKQRISFQFGSLRRYKLVKYLRVFTRSFNGRRFFPKFQQYLITLLRGRLDNVLVSSRFCYAGGLTSMLSHRRVFIALPFSWTLKNCLSGDLRLRFGQIIRCFPTKFEKERHKRWLADGTRHHLYMIEPHLLIDLRLGCTVLCSFAQSSFYGATGKLLDIRVFLRWKQLRR